MVNAHGPTAAWMPTRTSAFSALGASSKCAAQEHQPADTQIVNGTVLTSPCHPRHQPRRCRPPHRRRPLRRRAQAITSVVGAVLKATGQLAASPTPKAPSAAFGERECALPCAAQSLRVARVQTTPHGNVQVGTRSLQHHQQFRRHRRRRCRCRRRRSHHHPRHLAMASTRAAGIWPGTSPSAASRRTMTAVSCGILCA